MRRSLMLPVLALTAGVLAGCGGGESTPPATVTVTAPAAAGSSSGAAAPAQQVEVPDIVGQNGAIAEDTLKQAGFTNVQLASRDASSKVVLVPANWTVTKVDPKAGTTVASNRLIVVTMSKQQ